VNLKEVEMEQIIHERTNHGSHRLIESVPSEENQQPKGRIHACKASQRNLQLAGDRLRRANRDLGETAAFILASLTTVTAVEAVINIAVKQISISQEFLKGAFNLYIAIFILIFLWGAFRSGVAIRRRARAERDIDQAKKGMFEFCPENQWPKEDE
jgi:hypothetical protein